MKIAKYILYSLIIAAVGGLLVYFGYVEKTLSRHDLLKCILLLGTAIAGIAKVKNSRAKVENKKATYQKAYGEFIAGAFEGDRKLEKQFYNAIHDYNQNQPSKAIPKLEKLRKECQRSADLRAVTVFTALCLDDMGLYDQAVKEYEAAVNMRPSATLYSNLGLCYQRLGQVETAEKHYRTSIQLDSKNAFAYNNLSALYFRQGDYAHALDYALQAIGQNNTMPQALSTAAMCYGMMNDQENFDKYYRLAVSNGYDGRRIHATLERLKTQ